MTDDYSALSAVYDALNGDLDYEGWADYLDREIRAHADIPVKLVLDRRGPFARDALDRTGKGDCCRARRCHPFSLPGHALV